MTTDEQYMRKAIAEAEQAAAEGEIPIGAVVVCRGRILARTHNLTETLHDVTAHAEMQAITAAANALGGKYLQDCTLYVTLFPCNECSKAITQSGIKELVYAENKYENELSTQASLKLLTLAGIKIRKYEGRIPSIRY